MNYADYVRGKIASTNNELDYIERVYKSRKRYLESEMTKLLKKVEKEG